MKKYGKMILVVVLLLLGAWLNGVITIDVNVNWNALVSTFSTFTLTVGVNIVCQYIVTNDSKQAEG